MCILRELIKSNEKEELVVRLEDGDSLRGVVTVRKDRIYVGGNCLGKERRIRSYSFVRTPRL